jgi:peptide/nickel transport system substrate-binding protein
MNIKRFVTKSHLMFKKIILDLKRSHLRDLRNGIFLYLKKTPQIVHLRELILVTTILAGIVLIMFFQRFSTLRTFYQKHTPDYGGTYTEGVVGDIEKINPLFIKNEAEASANRLVFSGLTRIIPNNIISLDLAEKWTVQDNGQVYIFKLKRGLKWSDGWKLTADDIIFTLNLIQNPDTRTNQSVIWQNVSAEKINDQEVKFTLPNLYSDFLRVASQPILPEHLLKEINPSGIKVAEFNLKPVGSGPYKFIRFDQAGNETKVILEANNNFALKKPYIKRVNLRLYDSFETLYNGLLRKQIDGIAQIPYNKIDDITKLGSMEVSEFYLPRYKVLVLNSRNPLLSQKETRQAINQAINRQEIISQGLNNKAVPIYTSILPGKDGYNPALNKNPYNLSQANELLDKAGWAKGKRGFREKEGKTLSFRLVVSADSEDKRVGEIIKNQLSKLGIEIKLVVAEKDLFQADYIRPRNFDLILVGQNIGSETDLFSFWHSSQVNDPGLNLSGFKDRKVDKLIEAGRRGNSHKLRDDKYKMVQETLAAEVPAVFLYNPIYAFGINSKVKGIKAGKIDIPTDHLNDVFDWYINEKTKR